MTEDQDITSPLLLGATGSADLTVDEAAATDEFEMEPSHSGRANSNSIRICNSLTQSQRDVTAIDEERKKGCCSNFCTLMDTWPVTFVVVAALIGIGIGIGLSMWVPEPGKESSKEVTILWIGLLGDLFIRSLKCIVLPLVFVSIAISVMDMLSLGKAGKIVGTTIGLYLCTTICAALIGVMSSVIFSKHYALNDGVGEEEVPADVRLGCYVDQHGEIESFLMEQADGSVMCMAGTGDDASSLFRMEDVNGYFKPAHEPPTKLSLSESIYQGLFLQLIDKNMIGMFYDDNFLGVIVLGAGFGVALTSLAKNMPSDVSWDKILLIQVLEELMQVFMFFIHWIIKITPFAIISLIAKAIGEQEDIATVMQQLGYLMAATILALLVQVVVVYLGLYTLIVKSNPFTYLKHMVPAQLMGFASASSAATIPVSIDCATSSGRVPEGVARFCIPLGATVNMDGGAIYIITANIWLAYQNGIVPTATEYILLVVCATLGSMGTAPVPSAVIVLILTAYNTTFGAPAGGGEPAGLAYLFAVDWLLDRFRTVVNLTGDLTVTGIVSSKVSDDQAEQLGDLVDGSGTKDV